MKLSEIDYQILAAEQVRLESEMLAASKSRFWDVVEKSFAAGTAAEQSWGQKLIREWMIPTVEALEAWFQEHDGGRGRPPFLVHAIRALGVDVLALIALRSVFSHMMLRPSVAVFALRVAEQVVDELHIMRLEETLEPREFKWLEERANRAGWRRNRTYQAAAKSAGVIIEAEKGQLIALGVTIIQLLVDVVGVIAFEDVTTPDKTVDRRVVMSGARTAELEALLEAEAHSPDIGFWPMVCPPKQWSRTRQGGYLTTEVRRKYRLFTGVGVGAGSRGTDSMQEQHSDAVYSALNAMQDTAFQVNAGVLDVIERLQAAGISLPKMGSPSDVQFPEEPDITNVEQGSEEWTAMWRAFFRAKAKAQEQYDKVAGNRMDGERAIAQARLFKDYGRIWMPYWVDFRGRVYPMAPGLNPQGSKMAQGLLRFADGVEVGPHGYYWLMVHAANVYGEDKLSLDDRRKWAIEHSYRMCEAARDPIGTVRWWGKAEKPYHFLAVCLEWPSMMKNGYYHVSHLSVQQDGSCNGLQHLSAMSRDPATAALVNLTDSERPQDVYRTVAEATIRALEGMDEIDPEDYDTLQAWLDYGISRKDTKRSVMTLPYGSTLYATGDFIREAVVDRLGFASEGPFTMGISVAVSWLKPIMWKAIQETIPGARITMDWLRGSVKAANKANLPVSWTTPDGFKVVQDYRILKTKMIDIRSVGSRLQIRLNEPTPEIDSNRQRNGIAPNFVHSMDACAMRMYVNKARAAGIRSHWMIHDSFGTHAGHVELMNRLLREAFVEMYSGDVTASLLDSLEAQGTPYTTELPKGDFDVSNVLGSRYFFA